MTYTATLNELVSSNPATGEPVGAVPVTPVEDIPALCARAREAQIAWSARSLAERIDILRSVVPVLEPRIDEIGALVTAEMGKPSAEGIGEVRYGVGGINDELDEIAAALAPSTIADDDVETTMHRDPLGVCVAITPWNFPFLMPLQVVVPALAAGNSVILKPSEMVPLVGQAFADAFNTVLPEGVLQVVHGADDQGKALVRGDCDLIGFVGSREAGCDILSAAGSDLKRVVLELGGKDPMIVLDDADIEKAADFAATNSFRNCGQVCVSTERIYVHDAVAEELEQAIARRAADLVVGDGTTEGVTMGPMVNSQQKAHVLAQLEQARADGATIVLEGEDMDGNFIGPSVLTGLNHDMAIMRDETFGPLACIVRVSNDDEAVRLANDTPYGLGAAVFGGDTQRASDVARRLTAGMVGINKGCGGAKGTPWVGAQQSGYGFHSGPEGHRQFTQVRLVSMPRSS